MALTFQRARRAKAKLRLALAGPSGAGKTYSALLIASGIVPLEKVAVIDTENGSADLYADLGGYSTLTLQPPYSPQKYIEAIHAAEQVGFELVIIDSLSHAWSGQGGLLDQQGKATDTKYRGNSWAAWREITPLHNQLVETMLHSPLHLIATMRSKTEYVQSEVNGRKKIEKVGMAPVQRDGIEYEFTTVFDLSINHTAMVSKDRTKLFDGQYFVPNAEVGKALLQWLNAGGAEPAPAAVQETPAAVAVSDADMIVAYQARIARMWRDVGWEGLHDLDAYILNNLARVYGEGAKTVADMSLSDWRQLDTDLTTYLDSLHFNHVTLPQQGEPMDGHIMPI